MPSNDVRDVGVEDDGRFARRRLHRAEQAGRPLDGHRRRLRDVELAGLTADRVAERRSAFVRRRRRSRMATSEHDVRRNVDRDTRRRGDRRPRRARRRSWRVAQRTDARVAGRARRVPAPSPSRSCGSVGNAPRPSRHRSSTAGATPSGDGEPEERVRRREPVRCRGPRRAWRGSTPRRGAACTQSPGGSRRARAATTRMPTPSVSAVESVSMSPWYTSTSVSLVWATYASTCSPPRAPATTALRRASAVRIDPSCRRPADRDALVPAASGCRRTPERPGRPCRTCRRRSRSRCRSRRCA